MTFKEIQELIKLITKTNLTEFKVKNGDFELSIRTDKYEKFKQQMPSVAPSPSPAQQAPIIQMPAVPPAFTPAPAPAAAPQQASAPSQPEAKSEQPGDGDAGQYKEIRSPIVGTFYRSSSPEKPPYAKVGDSIEVGQVVCIVEAMKLFNEIESEISGKIVKVVVEDAQPVEYDQVLFLVDPKA